MLWALGLLVVAIFLLGLFIPNLLGSRGAAGHASFLPSVDVEVEAVVGSYELAALRADTPEDLDAWLDAGGFRGVPAEGRPVVEDYIRRGWRFVAAKLRRTGEGLSRPHPLAMTFPCDSPVYPMRLTALAGAPVALDLYVAGERQAVVRGLSLAYSDRFRSSESKRSTGPVLEGAAFRHYLGHPDTWSYLWDGCVLTRLSGTVDPEGGMDDLAIGWTEHSPYRPLRWSPVGASKTGQGAAMLLWALAAPILVLWCRPAEGDRGRRQLLILGRAVVPALGIAFAAWGLTYLACPKVEVVAGAPPSRTEYEIIHGLAVEARHLIEQEPRIAGAATEEIARRVAARVRPKNPYTGAPLAVGDGPGDFLIVRKGQGLELRYQPLADAPAVEPVVDDVRSFTDDVLWLDTLNLSYMKQGWGTPKARRSVEGRPLSIPGYGPQERGIGTHAGSNFAIDLQGSALEFHALAGIDEEAFNTPGSVVFQVYVDERLAWESGIVGSGGRSAQEVRVPLEGARRLRLVVTDAGDGIHHDHADWAMARILLVPGWTDRPRAVGLPDDR